MIVQQSGLFRRAVKKLHPEQKLELDAAIRQIAKKPEIGETKVGDLAGIRVHKFKLSKQQCLLAYTFSEPDQTLTLMALGSHENFYRDLKR